MILVECGIFAAMFLSGMAAGILAVSLDVIGKAGKAARAVTDVMIAAEMGALYFISLYHVSCGVFRLYSLAAFLFGALLARVLCKRFEPTFRRVMRRLVEPLASAYGKALSRWENFLRPYREKRAARRLARQAAREEKKASKRALTEEKREAKKASFAKKLPRKNKIARIVVER